MRSLEARRAIRILSAQSATTLVVSAIALFAGGSAALSALVGGGAATLANALFAWWIFGRYRAQEPGQLVFRFYGAELVKLFVLIAMLGAAFAWLRPLSPAALIGAFFVVQVLPPLLANRLFSPADD